MAEATDTAEVQREYKIPVKGGGEVLVNTRDIPDNVYAAALQIGLKDLVNRGMTKVKVRVNGKALEGEDADKAKAAGQEIAEKNLASLKAGQLPRIAGMTKADSKVPGVVMTEARRLAKNYIKDEIKAAGGKISHYEAKDITAAANALLATDEGKAFVEEAKANVAKREQLVKPKAIKSSEEVTATEARLGIKSSAKKVQQAADKAAKEKADKVLSATQAGKVRPRTPQGQRPQAR